MNLLSFNNTAGEKIVEIDLDTGKVTLFTTPNEAAIEFWKAVEIMYPHKNKE